MTQTAHVLASELGAWFDRLFPDVDRGEQLKRALTERFGDDVRPVTAELCREFETVAHAFSRHFALEFVADGTLVPDTDPPGWPPQDPAEVERRAGSVGQVERRPGGVGVLALDSLDSVRASMPKRCASSASRVRSGAWGATQSQTQREQGILRCGAVGGC